MSNRTEAATRKLRQTPPGGYRHCACSRLHPEPVHSCTRGESAHGRFDGLRIILPLPRCLVPDYTIFIVHGLRPHVCNDTIQGIRGRN